MENKKLKDYLKTQIEFGFYIVADGKRELNLHRAYKYGFKDFEIGKKYYPVSLISNDEDTYENLSFVNYAINKVWFSEDEIEKTLEELSILGRNIGSNFVPVFIKRELEPIELIKVLKYNLSSYDESVLSYDVDRYSNSVEMILTNIGYKKTLEDKLNRLDEYFPVRFKIDGISQSGKLLNIENEDINDFFELDETITDDIIFLPVVTYSVKCKNNDAKIAKDSAKYVIERLNKEQNEI